MISNDLKTIQNALEAAITDIRTISAGLRIPELVKMSPMEVIQRAIKDYERKTNLNVSLEVFETPPSVTESVKITLYRLVQEALSNSYRHAKGANQFVQVRGNKGQIEVEIEDDGKGFDVETIKGEDHLGLAGMRERVEVLGGEFKIITYASRGTKIIASLPLFATEEYIEDHHD
jgi:signal transduction histidine kinase